jgi:uncharacterized protein YdeI (BOF family)
MRQHVLFAIGVVALVLIGCQTMGTPPFPSPIPTRENALNDAAPVTVKELIDRSQEYAGRTVTLTGKIITECPQGCWFFLNDGTGSIYIDLQPAGLTIPQKIGARVTLRGKIKGSGGNLQILGEEVKFLE